MLVTVFLSVMIVALALGNAFLSLAGPKRLFLAKSGLREEELPEGSERVFSGEALKPALAGPVQVPARGSSDSERIAFLGKRIERLEQLLLKIDNSKFVAQKINATNLFQKLKELEQFKQDTRLEIAALKQRLDRVQPVKAKQKKNFPEISDEKLRRIVFRSTS